MVYIAVYLLVGIVAVLLGAVEVDILDAEGNSYATAGAFVGVLMWFPLMIMGLMNV